MTIRERILVGLAALVVAGTSLTIAVAAPFTATKPPPNDNFARAQIVGVSGAIAGSTAGAGAQRGEPGTGRHDRTVWFEWTPAEPGTAFVVATRRGEAVHVRAYTGTSLRRLERVDGAGSSAQHVLATIDAFSGVTYRIQVDAGTSAGGFALQVVQPQAGRPVNATSATATSLSQAIRDAALGNASGATVSGTTAGAGGAVFYRWTAPPGTRGRLGARLVGVTLGRHLRLRLGGAGGGGRQLAFEAVAGRTYTVAVVGDQAYFGLALTPSRSFRLDTKPPTVDCHALAGWSRTNAAVHCTARDGGSGLADPAQHAFTLLTAVPAGSASASATTNGVSVCDRAGNCATAGPITGLRIDRSQPSVTCAPVSGTGWHISVMVNCQASDPAGGSGLADPADRSFTLSATLPAGQVSTRVAFTRHAPVCDLAGNCVAVAAPAPVAIDRMAPRVTCGRAPTGWVGGASIRCTAGDAQSGLASPSDASFALITAVGAGISNPRAYTNSHAVCDVVGNCAIAGPIGPIRVDRQPPVVTCRPPLGWVRGRLGLVRCRAVDHGSGLVGPSSFVLPAGIAAGGEGRSQSSQRQVCDRAGNCAAAGPFTVGLDDKPPSISCDPVPRAWQAAPVTIACHATDYGSGVAPAQQLVLLQASVRPGTRGIVGFPRRRLCDLAGNCAMTPRLARAKIDRRRKRR